MTMTVIQEQATIGVEFLLIADAVQVSEGKLSILGGGWTAVTLPSFPMPFRYGIAVGLVSCAGDSPARFDLNIALLDAANTGIAELKAAIDIKALPPDKRHPENVFYGANAISQLPAPGVYRFRARAGNSIKEAQFEAVLKS
jgi:hypothetical protein